MSVGKLVLDYDGVIADSLESHLHFCRDLSDSYCNGNLIVPTVEEHKGVIRYSAYGGNLLGFLRAIKFPEIIAQEGYIKYKKCFLKDYYLDAPIYPNTHSALVNLSFDWDLSILSSNTFKNVSLHLEHNQLDAHIPTDCVFTPDNTGKTKGEFLKDLKDEGHKIVFVGDTLSDRDAAAEADVTFIAAVYGWGLIQDDCDLFVNDISEIVSVLDRSII